MPDANTLNPANRFIIWLGLAQGVTLYALYSSHKQLVWKPGSEPWFNALLLLALLSPFVVYWSQGLLAVRQAKRLLLVSGLVLLALGAYQGMTLYPLPSMNKVQLVSFPVFIGLALLSFMLVPLVSAWRGKGQRHLTLGRWDYALLFEQAWRNAVITVQAGVLTGLLWIVLQLGAQLFRLIGINWPGDLLREAWFAIPVTTFSVALGVRAGLRRAAFTHNLRNHWLTLTAWLLPIVSLIGASFALTSLGGVDKLFERGLSAFFLLWFAAFWIKFFNSSYQDGKASPPFPGWLQRVLPYTALGLMLVAGFASWALLLRIQQHGLTPDRIWGLFVALVALCYGVGYSTSLMSKSGWMRNIASANVVAALMMCSGIVLLLSPVLDARKLATQNQMLRLSSGIVKADGFDTQPLAQQGSFGYQALRELAAQRDAQNKPTHLAVRAEVEMESAARYRERGGKDGDKITLVTDIRTQLDTFPETVPIPADYVDFLKSDIGKWPGWESQQSCFERRNEHVRCQLLQIDLNSDGVNEMVLWKGLNDLAPKIYAQAQGRWRRVGFLRTDDYRRANANVQADLHVGAFDAEAPAWSELRIGKTRFRVKEIPQPLLKD